MLAQFQSLYPTGCLITELVQIDRGKYIVRSSVQIEGVTRATGMAAAETIEEAEDRSRTRALMVLAMKEEAQTEVQNKVQQKEVSASLETNLQVLENRALSSPVAEASKYANTNANSETVTQTAPSSTPPINSNEVTQTQLSNTASISRDEVTQGSDVSPTPEVFSAEDNSDIYSEDFDKPFPIPTYNEPEFDTPIENTDIASQNQLDEVDETSSNLTSLNKSTIGKTTKKTTKTSTSKRKKKVEPIDLSDVIAKTDVEMERLGWTAQQGRQYLINTYGKRGRTLLSEEELLDFLQYLESIPTQTELSETDPLAGF